LKTGFAELKENAGFKSDHVDTAATQSASEQPRQAVVGKMQYGAPQTAPKLKVDVSLRVLASGRIRSAATHQVACRS